MQPHLLTSGATRPRVTVDDAVTLPRVARIAARCGDGDVHAHAVATDDGATLVVEGMSALPLTAGDGGLWWVGDDGATDLLGLTAAIPEGDLGLVCDDLATVAHLTARARDEGLGFTAIGVTADGLDADRLLEALDAVAPARAWVVATRRIGTPETLAALLRRIAVHRPVFAAWPLPAASRAEDAWRDGLAVVTAASLDAAFDRAAGLAALVPPAGPSIGVFARDEGVAIWAARSISRAGGRVEVHAVDHPIEAAALQRERLDHDLIAVVAPPGTGGAVRALTPSDLLSGPELPIVVIAADRDTRLAARQHGLCAVPTLDATATLLGAMSHWGRAADRALAQLEPTGRVADPARLRGALAAARRRGAASVDDGPEVAAALGLPMGERATVRWPDDALLAASGFGYPVEVASVEPRSTERADDADHLAAVVARRLADARAAAGPEAAVEVRALGADARRWVLSVRREAPWGAFIEATVDGAHRAWACPVDHRFGVGLLDPRPARGALEQDVLVDVARALDAAAATVQDAPALRLTLDVDDRGGRVVALTLEADE